MNAHHIVTCLLDSAEQWTPDGYQLLATATAGEYELKLWSGKKHMDGQAVVCNELSLNRHGLNFDPASQSKKFRGSAHALGHRQDFLGTIADWVRRYGALFVGSHNPEKVKLYHRLFKHYLGRLTVSDIYPPFDESEGEPDYFKVDASRQTLESVLGGGGPVTIGWREHKERL